MSSDLVRFSVAIPEGLLNEFDAYAARRGISANRSEAVRDLIREKLVEEDIHSPNEEVVGSITMIYDHHTPGLAAKLDEVQHGYTDLIVSAMHVHLDHANCLEIIAVRGAGSRVRVLADQLLGIKGVRHGKLDCAASGTAIENPNQHVYTHGHDHGHSIE